MTSLAFLLLLVPVAVFSHELKQEYYTTVVFSCNQSEYNFTNDAPISAQYWMLPNGDLLSANYSSKHISIDSEFKITINHIDDIDFGYYLCLLVRSDYTVDKIRYGLNTDGPYYGDLLSLYSQKAMVGGIAAGSLFVVITVFCVVWQLRYHKRSQRNKAVDELDKAIDGYDLKAYNNVAIELDDDSKKSSPRSNELTAANGTSPAEDENRF